MGIAFSKSTHLSSLCAATSYVQTHPNDVTTASISDISHPAAVLPADRLKKPLVPAGSERYSGITPEIWVKIFRLLSDDSNRYTRRHEAEVRSPPPISFAQWQLLKFHIQHFPVKATAEIFLDAGDEAVRFMRKNAGLRRFLLTTYLQKPQNALHERILTCGNDETAWQTLKRELAEKPESHAPMPRHIAFFLAAELEHSSASAEPDALEGKELRLDESQRALAVTALATRMPIEISERLQEGLYIAAIRQLPTCNDELRLALYRLLSLNPLLPKSPRMKTALIEVVPRLRTNNTLNRIETELLLQRLAKLYDPTDDHDTEILSATVVACTSIAEHSKTNPAAIGTALVELMEHCEGDHDIGNLLVDSVGKIPEPYRLNVLRDSLRQIRLE